ncbi:uncharacterized protein N7506_008234 [Penicillium brevicompactum]|uniref:uncharacterized protein n=1 Tax=Penicillium brevicompactum TaxID=5074 RepID=UPI002541DE3B|nr:uncharacterized protein N7506_008234 [Penicillium brevicompactum]KAJ5325132.1 hypothetical protein N7506_008234 [Penicillium brevicompactum]
MKFSIPSLALAALVAPTLAQVVPGSVDINYHSGYDRYQGRGGECSTSKAPEKDVTSINISAFAPGPVTCDFYTFGAHCDGDKYSLTTKGGIKGQQFSKPFKVGSLTCSA